MNEQLMKGSVLSRENVDYQPTKKKSYDWIITVILIVSVLYFLGHGVVAFIG